MKYRRIQHTHYELTNYNDPYKSILYWSQSKKKEDSKKFAGLVPTSMIQVLAPECGNGLG